MTLFLVHSASHCLIFESKGKVFPVFLTENHAMKAYGGCGRIAPHILWPRHWMEMNGQLKARAALPPEKEPLVFIG